MHSPHDQHLSGLQSSSDALHDFAPGLERHLIQMFKDNAAVLEEIRAVFQYSFTQGGREDPRIPRRADESYNPRCARLPQLLISEAMEIGASSIMCAMLLPLSSNERIAAAPTSNLIKAHVLDALEAPSGRDNSPIPEITNLTLVNWIDHVRHLHISSREKEAQNLLMMQAKTVLSTASTQYPHPRLMVLLNHAINQQERRWNE